MNDDIWGETICCSCFAHSVIFMLNESIHLLIDHSAWNLEWVCPRHMLGSFDRWKWQTQGKPQILQRSCLLSYSELFWLMHLTAINKMLSCGHADMFFPFGAMFNSCFRFVLFFKKNKSITLDFYRNVELTYIYEPIY